MRDGRNTQTGWEAPSALGQALALLDRGLPVSVVARRVNRTARCVRGWFDEAVGVSPVQWAGLQRLWRAMDLSATGIDGAEAAVLAGFADQAHLCRAFRATAGITMTQWRQHRPGAPAHVPVTWGHPVSDSFKPSPRPAP